MERQGGATPASAAGNRSAGPTEWTQPRLSGLARKNVPTGMAVLKMAKLRERVSRLEDSLQRLQQRQRRNHVGILAILVLAYGLAIAEILW